MKYSAHHLNTGRPYANAKVDAGLISFDEAVRRITCFAKPVGSENVCLNQAGGRVLASAVIASRCVPPAAVSAMDGYAVRDADLQNAPTHLNIIGKSFAGTGFSGLMRKGECVRIFTGAPVPHGADRVVIQENVISKGDKAFFSEPPVGRNHVREAGSDFTKNAIVIPAGRLLKPQHLIAAAAANFDKLKVQRRPRVHILCCGDELVPAGTRTISEEQMPESISFGVSALVHHWGADVTGYSLLPDDLSILEAAALSALQTSDLIVIIGGASVGERDYAKPAFARCGMQTIFNKVAIKPGKPVWLGNIGTTPILGLPGNPASALVTARLLLAPLIAGMSGRNPSTALVWHPSHFDGLVDGCSDRDFFIRAYSTQTGVRPLKSQGSADQKSLADADILVRIPPGTAIVSTPSIVEALEL